MLGIIGALDFEIEKLVEAMQVKETASIAGITFHKGSIKGCDAIVAKCGVGKVSAAVCAQLMITVYGADRLVNTGVAGGLMHDLKQCDLVVADAFVQHDIDTTALGDPIGLVSPLDRVEMVCSRSLSAMLGDIAPDARTGLIATGDQFIADHDRARQIASVFGAAACDMEGGAIAQVCIMNGVRFAALRCISDNADGSAGMSYNAFAPKAAERCASMVIELAGRLAE